jgi:predicted dienelactone hydrolase
MKALVAVGLLCATLMNHAMAVGFARVTVPDATDKPLSGGIWYPSKTAARAHPDSPAGQVVAFDGAIAGQRLALIVISHGSGGLYTSHRDTALALAEAGFVVAAVTHTGDNADDDSAAASRWMLDRPRHVGILIDYLLAQWPGHDRIDPSRIGVFGFSAGGYTALAAIGGVPDLTRALVHCTADPHELLCRLGATRDFNDPKVAAQFAAGWKRGPRIGAAVIAAPGMGFAFDPDSLQAIKIPIQLWAAGDDRNVPSASNTAIVREALGTAPEFHEVARAGHYAFLPVCTEQQARVAIGARICLDAPGFDRAAFHQEFNRDVVAFFLAHLPAH